MKHVMTKAWEIAKEGVKKFGGKAIEYISEALRMAWAIVKKEENNNMKVSKWVTENGAEVEMHTEHITKKEVDADGWKVEVDADEIVVHKVIVNGHDFGSGYRTNHKGKITMYMGNKYFAGKTRPIYVTLNSDVEESVWGEYDRRVARKREAARKADIEYEKHYNRVLNAMGE